jgi:hypothetical protein
MAEEYATAAEFKAYLRIEDSIDDNIVDTPLDAAHRGLEDYCGRVFYAASPATARDFYAEDWRLCRTDDVSIGSGAVLQTDTSGTGTFATTLTVGTDFQFEPLNGVVGGISGYPYTRIRLVGGSTFPCSYYGRPNVRVTAHWGWAAVPPVIKMATLELAKDMYKSNAFSAGAIGFGDVFARIRDNPMLVSRLANYRHPSVALMVA